MVAAKKLTIGIRRGKGPAWSDDLERVDDPTTGLGVGAAARFGPNPTPTGISYSYSYS